MLLDLRLIVVQPVDLVLIAQNLRAQIEDCLVRLRQQFSLRFEEGLCRNI